jgi:nitrite reductase/ring-hydroxylating ferredoxin subunit
VTTETHPHVSANVPESMPTVADYLRKDPGHIPEALFERSTHDLGNEPIDKASYTTRAHHELEKTRLWNRVWQMACRNNDIPEVGDRVVYDILDQSIVVVRSAPEEIKAFHNVCMHRGNRLVDPAVGDPATGTEFTCTFHKWSYHLDGSIKEIPCRWDFPNVRNDDVHLAEVKTATWNGFVFINLDPDCESFDDFIGETLPEHFRNWPRDDAFKVAHVGKVIPCNWKLALEAFLELYHAIGTHPTFLQYSGDCNSQYDFWGRHARMISCVGVPSPYLGDVDDPQFVVDAMVGDSISNIMNEGDLANMPQLPQDATLDDARHMCADFVRGSMSATTGVDYSRFSDSEMLDAVQYFVFPNLVPWAGNAFPLCYRVRPHGDDHQSCIFEVIILASLPDGAPLPKDTPLRMTPPDEPWAEAKELGGAGPILDQDMVNLLKMQRGVNTSGLKQVQFANYQERNIRHLHQTLDQFIAE